MILPPPGFAQPLPSDEEQYEIDRAEQLARNERWRAWQEAQAAQATDEPPVVIFGACRCGYCEYLRNKP